MRPRFIKSSEKKKILKELNEQFGIKKIPYLLIKGRKEKIKGFSGDLSKDEISELGRTINIETIGLYLIRKERSIRISLDGAHVLKNQITKNILEIEDKHLIPWFKGQDLEIESNLKGTVIIKHENDFIGCGKSTGDKILNHIPKGRRIKN